MTTVTMPQLGESVTEGTILEWFKQPGDAVKLDDALCEIETEKVTAELPSPFEGTMGEILVPQGETVDVDTPLCEIDVGAATAVAREPDAGATTAVTPEPVAVSASVEREAPAPTSDDGQAPTMVPHRAPGPRKRLYSPVVMQLAQEYGLDLTQIDGSGIGGRVTRKDVQATIAAEALPKTPKPAEPALVTPPEAPPVEAPEGTDYAVVTLSPTRKSIAAAMSRSNREAPQAWTMVEVDVTGLVRLRNEEKERYREDLGLDLTLLPYFTVAVARSLGEHPELNARWDGDELRRYRPLNLGIAVATDHGLIVPVIHDSASLSLVGIARQINDLAERARTRKLRIEDIEGGTFTVNNTGAFGSITSKPIVNYPQVAIVSMERVVRRPVVVEDDAIAVRSMLNVCLSFDHRALDGDEAGAFLASMKQHLEAFGS